jgi:D-3-phosphoglycerate dehydrogenase
MDVIAWTFNPSDERARKLGLKYVDLDVLLETADVVSLHVKLTDDSRGLIGADQLRRMKPTAILLNGARGPVVDTAALIEVLNAGAIAGAGIDVFDEEPLPADHPILSCDQVVLTPHCADMTPEGVDLLNSGAVENVIAFLEGRPQNAVT